MSASLVRVAVSQTSSTHFRELSALEMGSNDVELLTCRSLIVTTAVDCYKDVDLVREPVRRTCDDFVFGDLSSCLRPLRSELGA